MKAKRLLYILPPHYCALLNDIRTPDSAFFKLRIVLLCHWQIFQGNFDNETHRKNVLDPPIYARFIRILPWSWYGRITMRAELLGCPEEQWLYDGLCKNKISNGDLSRMPFGLIRKWKIFWLQSMIVNDCDDFEWIFVLLWKLPQLTMLFKCYCHCTTVYFILE